jgi:hypothetical protein
LPGPQLPQLFGQAVGPLTFLLGPLALLLGPFVLLLGPFGPGRDGVTLSVGPP